MFRLLPTCIGRHISKSLPSLQAHCSLFSAAISSRQFTSDGFNNGNKDIDFNILFSSCTKVHLAKCLHAFLLVSGKGQNIFLSARLVNLYAYLGDVSFAQRTFDQIPKKDVYTWNSMVSAYVRIGRFRDAINCFYLFLLTSGVRPDSYSFPSVLKACGNLVDGKKMHCWVLKLGFEWDVFVAASLVHMYSRAVHGFIVRRGWLMEDVVIGNAIVDMYAKLGAIDSASTVFEGIPVKDAISWNSLITGYAQNGLASEAIEVYRMMEEHKEIIPNQGTWVPALLTCMENVADWMMPCPYSTTYQG
nr:pentatricopeptide repeat-containing protein [Quercus suber]